MTPGSLIKWASLHERRERSHKPGAWLRSAVFGCAVVCAVIAADLMRRHMTGGGATVAAGDYWLLVVGLATAFNVLAAPHRLFWSPDTRVLIDLPVGGRALVSLGWWRCLRTVALAFAPAAVVTVFTAAVGDTDVAYRMLIGGVACAAISAGLAPAAALFAGMLVSSSEVLRAMQALAGEFRPPDSSWLGIIPGIVGAAGVVLAVGTASWVSGNSAMQSLIPGASIAAVVVSAIAVFVVHRLTDTQMLLAVRAAQFMDRQRLAHVDLTTASRVERLWTSMCDSVTKLVAHKDVAIARRRYPFYFFSVWVAVVALWTVAAVGGEGVLIRVSSILAAIHLYSVILVRRSFKPPIEHMRLLRTLPIGKRHVMRAKHTLLLLRVVTVSVVGIGPCMFTADQSVVVAVIAVFSGVSAMVVGRVATNV